MKFALLQIKKAIKPISLIITILTLTFLLKGVSAEQVFSAKPTKLLPIYSVETSEKKLAISFDCAWGVDYTDELLKVMQEENIHCTFFCVEFWSNKYPEYLKKIVDYGHEIGTHSSTHPYMSKLSKEGINNELTSSTAIIEKETGQKVSLFRAPYGDYNDLVIKSATDLGLFTIQWSIDSLDWKDLSANEIYNRVVSRAHNGAIVLFHNQGKHTAKALPKIIKDLKNKGYSFVKISDLIYKENYQMLPNGAQAKVN